MIENVECQLCQGFAVLGWQEVPEHDVIGLHTCLEGEFLFFRHLGWSHAEVVETLIQVKVVELIPNCGEKISETKAVLGLLGALEEVVRELRELLTDDLVSQEELKDLVLDHVCEHTDAHLK